VISSINYAFCSDAKTVPLSDEYFESHKQERVFCRIALLITNGFLWYMSFREMTSLQARTTEYQVTMF